MTEDELRELAGYGGPAEVTFMGEQWAIRSDGLTALIRYSHSAGLEDSTAAMAAVYQLIADVITDFAAFERAAFTGKAKESDVTSLVHDIIEHYCARNRWPAMRLIGQFGASLEEIDGKLLLATGRGVAGLSAREACNLALTLYLDGRDEEDRGFALEDLNYQGNPEGDALKLLRQMQAEAKAAGDGERQP